MSECSGDDPDCELSDGEVLSAVEELFDQIPEPRRYALLVLVAARYGVKVEPDDLDDEPPVELNEAVADALTESLESLFTAPRYAGQCLCGPIVAESVAFVLLR
jgi:hypothetical protein